MSIVEPFSDQNNNNIDNIVYIFSVVELKRDVEYRVTFSIGTGTTNIALHM